MSDKSLDVTNMKELQEQVSDVKVHGDPGAWVCICKASSETQNWMKSTKRMRLPGIGWLYQVSTQQGLHVAEALVFVPDVEGVLGVTNG